MKKRQKISLFTIVKTTEKEHGAKVKQARQNDRRIYSEDRQMRKALRIASTDFIDPYKARQASLDLIKAYNRGAPKYTSVGVLIFISGLLFLCTAVCRLTFDKIPSLIIDAILFFIGIGWGFLAHSINDWVKNRLRRHYLDNLEIQIVALQILHEDKTGNWPNTQIPSVPPITTNHLSDEFDRLPSVWQARHEKFNTVRADQRTLLVNIPEIPTPETTGRAEKTS